MCDANKSGETDSDLHVRSAADQSLSGISKIPHLVFTTYAKIYAKIKYTLGYAETPVNITSHQKLLLLPLCSEK